MGKTYAKYASLYNFSYMSLGAMMPLIGQYLKYIGFSGTQIGIITATGTGVAIFASAFWGDRYSRSSRRHDILMMLCVMAAVSCGLLRGIESYWPFIMVFGIMYFFQAPVMSLTDAFTVESGQGFGSLRAWGAVGFALGTFLAGMTVRIAGIPVIFAYYMAGMALAAFMIWKIRHDDPRLRENRAAEEKKEKKKGGYIHLLRSKNLRRLIICTFFMGGTNVANNTYFSFLYTEGGGTVAGVGIALMLMVASEVPFMAWCERLARRFTMERLTAASMIVSVVRFAVYGAGLPWWGLILISFSQGAVNGILLIEFVKYAARLAPEGYESLAISAYYILGSNLSTIFCQFTGGLILDHMDAAAVYFFFSVFNLCGVILYFIFGLHRPEKERKKHEEIVPKSLT